VLATLSDDELVELERCYEALGYCEPVARSVHERPAESEREAEYYEARLGELAELLKELMTAYRACQSEEEVLAVYRRSWPEASRFHGHEEYLVNVLVGGAGRQRAHG
jgi:hypothetical protein